MSVTLSPQNLVEPASLQHSPLPAEVVSVTGTPTGSKVPRWLFVIFAMLALAASCILVNALIADPQYVGGTKVALVDGTTIFAVFFVAATAIERLLEPFSQWLIPKAKAEEEAVSKEGTAKQALAQVQRQNALINAVPEGVEVNRAALDGAINEAQEATRRSATADATLAEKEWQRTIVHWVVASCVGMVAAATFKLYFLATVGISQSQRWQEILATGLIIGAGTKPLHDLTELISAKKSDAETQPK